MDENKKNTVCSFCGRVKEICVNSPLTGAIICKDCAKDINLIFEISQENLNKKLNKEEAEDLLKDITPSKIKKALDDFVIGQDIAKKTISVAVYNHYKRITNNILSQNNQIKIDKSNILMIGPTGVGKTLIAKTLADTLKVPFAIADATTITEAGYVGDDVENVLLSLIQSANGDIKKAQKGIIYIDEIDKIARKGDNMSITRDVSGEGVQQALLKIIESTKASVPIMGGRKHPQGQNVNIDTTNILFILGGAFVGLNKIIARRGHGSSGLGFNNDLRQKIEEKSTSELIEDLTQEDLVKFGLIPELIGRVPIVVGLDELDEEAFERIIQEPKNSIIKQYKELFRLDNVDLEIEEDAIQFIAKRAKELKIGARGLRSILEKVMLETMYIIPEDKTIKKVIITKESITNPKEVKLIKT